MKRHLTLLAAAVAAASLLALPAAAGTAHNVFGTISGLTTHTISVKGRSGLVTTCALGARSPKLTGYSSGDHVQMVCLGGKRMSLLARIRHLAGKSVNGTASQVEGTVAFGGAITALSDTSISLHDGDRDLTCALDASSPATGDFKVGQHVKVTCTNGTLTTIAAITSADAGRWFTGTVASITDGSITVNTEHGPVTCNLGPGSPSVAGLQEGDHVGIGCSVSTMQLVLLRKLDDSTDGSGSGSGGSGTTTGPGDDGDSQGDDGQGNDNDEGGGDSGSQSAPPPGDSQTTIRARGNVSAITDGAITVSTDGGSVSCSRDGESPSLDGYQAGDNVTIGCTGGKLRSVEKHT
jgi:hypothetical protein